MTRPHEDYDDRVAKFDQIVNCLHTGGINILWVLGSTADGASSLQNPAQWQDPMCYPPQTSATGPTSSPTPSTTTRTRSTLLLRDAKIRPAVNEMELHPHFQQQELFEYVLSRGIVPVGYCPIGSPERPERDKTSEDTSPVDDPVIRAIADRLGVHPAVICVKWAQQRGQVPIPFSRTRQNMRASIECVTTLPLSDEDMAAIARVDRNCARYAQVGTHCASR